MFYTERGIIHRVSISKNKKFNLNLILTWIKIKSIKVIQEVVTNVKCPRAKLTGINCNFPQQFTITEGRKWENLSLIVIPR